MISSLIYIYSHRLIKLTINLNEGIDIYIYMYEYTISYSVISKQITVHVHHVVKYSKMFLNDKES